MKQLEIPGYQAPSLGEVTVQALQHLAQQQAVMCALLECLYRATLGQEEEAIQKMTGVQLASSEGVADGQGSGVGEADTGATGGDAEG